MESSTMAVMLLQGSKDHFNTFDPLLARHYYFLARAYELSNNLVALHNFLMAGLRTAPCVMTKETKRPFIIVFYASICFKTITRSAGIFWKNSPFLLVAHNLNNQSARYRFYRARIAAVVGNYFEAAEDLSQALRKSTSWPFRVEFHSFSYEILNCCSIASW